MCCFFPYTLEEHIHSVQIIVLLVSDYGLNMRILIIVLDVDRIEFLGYVIECNGIRVDDSKIKVTQNIVRLTKGQNLEASVVLSLMKSSLDRPNLFGFHNTH